MLYPYRTREIKSLRVDLPIQSTARITRYVPSDKNVRKPTAVSLGCHVVGAALPHPDPSDAESVYDGARKRIAVEMPPKDMDFMVEFGLFVDDWLRENIEPAPPSTDYSVETWLEKTPYTAARKAELKRKYDAITDPFDPRYLIVKSFIKDETYVDYKFPRWINSRTDEFKTLVGPYCRVIDEILFKNKHFIKKIPARDRPKFIFERLYSQGGATIFSTDFRSFEAHFEEVLMENCEFKLYRHVLKFASEKDRIMHHLDALKRTNKCVNKYVTVEVEARRMSGEMLTSSGNGFTNLMLILFMMAKMMNMGVDVLVEGDDALGRFYGKFPTDELIGKLGLSLKIELVKDIASASFCGMVFDPIDMQNVTDPIVDLLGFGYTTQRYLHSKKKRHMELLRSKALSMAYSYDGCPILSALARFGLRVTHGYRARAPLMDMYNTVQHTEAMEYIKAKGIPNSRPGRGTRELVENLYKIPIDIQISYENYLDSLTTLQPLDLSPLRSFVPSQFVHYYENYAVSGQISYNIFPPKLEPIAYS